MASNNELFTKKHANICNPLNINYLQTIDIKYEKKTKKVKKSGLQNLCMHYINGMLSNELAGPKEKPNLEKTEK